MAAANEWFEYDGDLDKIERLFVDALRVRAAGWPESPLDSRLDPPGEGLPLIASLDIVDADNQLVLLTVGVHVHGRTIRGDELHNQLFTLPDEPTGLALTATGGPDELAAQTANWFESILRRQIVRHEWTHLGRVYAHSYLFADTGQRLVAMHNRELCPPGQLDRLAVTGHISGGGWVDTSGLGEPDAISHVRGDTP